jgi:glucoamylase
MMDGGFLELVRYGVRKPGDPLVEDSLRVVDAVLKVDTPFGPCWRRYNHDGYGSHPDGGPFTGSGQGRAWPLLTGERAHYEFAAGRDVRKMIRTMEQFAFAGRMLPEQVWDSPDVKSAGLYLGKPAGSAMPLMWAHAEYVKLLRSVLDGHVFDLIPVVAERYLKKRGRKNLEVWKPTRQVREVTAGQVLRIQSPESFRLRWTNNGWVSASDTPSTSSGIGIEFADIAIPGNQSTPVQFTFFWTGSNRWEGHNYEVSINQTHIRAVAA